MFAPESIYQPNDRVFVTSGPLHGFAGTVVSAPEAGKLILEIDGFNGLSQFKIHESDIELCDTGAERERPFSIFTVR